jgi:hypothetical protein
MDASGPWGKTAASDHAGGMAKYFHSRKASTPFIPKIHAE